MKPAASIETVLDFCNKVRKAGGGKPLDALLPGVPSDAQSCLIAKNLNFECRVTTVAAWEVAQPDRVLKAKGNNEDPWAMFVGDSKVRDRIAEALGLQAVDLNDEHDAGRYAVLLPRKIGNVAANFDNICDEFVSDFKSVRDGAIDEGKTPEQADKMAWQQATEGFTRAMKHYAKYAEVVEAA